LYVTDLPANLIGYSRWQVVDYHVGWVREVTQTELQNAINAKALKLSAYKAKYERIDLLLVADRVFGSGRFSLQADLKIENPGFSNIYFLSYPDLIQSVC